jgi:PAS domain S-box-containing protein
MAGKICNLNCLKLFLLDKRLKKINRILTDYSQGNFDKRLEVSHHLDEIDAFMAAINMLGEELKTTTISKNYFNNIFHSVSDMVFVLNLKGEITDINNSVTAQLEYNINSLKGTFIDELLPSDRRPLLSKLYKELKGSGYTTKKTYFKRESELSIPVIIVAVNLYNDKRRKTGILLTAKNNTLQEQTDNLIIRTIIDTQEKERKRLAKDIHDSLGQQLSAIKFYISAMAGLSMDLEQKTLLTKSNDALTKVLADMRSICFNLMPKTLEEFGLVLAVKELCSQIQRDHKIAFEIKQKGGLFQIGKELEIDVYRVIQEGIHNAIKHGKASLIMIKFDFSSNYIKVVLTDNGFGFNTKEIKSNGMGLQNIRSRIKSHNGEINITSNIGKGTNVTLSIPHKL